MRRAPCGWCCPPRWCWAACPGSCAGEAGGPACGFHGQFLRRWPLPPATSWSSAPSRGRAGISIFRATSFPRRRWSSRGHHAVARALQDLVLPAARQVLFGLAAAAVSLGCGCVFGLPDPQAVERLFEQKWGARSREVLDHRCSHVMGSYQDVWVTVYHADCGCTEGTAIGRSSVWPIGHPPPCRSGKACRQRACASQWCRPDTPSIPRRRCSRLRRAPIGPRPLERTDGVAVHSFESGVPGGNTGRDTSSP